MRAIHHKKKDGGCLFYRSALQDQIHKLKKDDKKQKQWIKISTLVRKQLTMFSACSSIRKTIPV